MAEHFLDVCEIDCSYDGEKVLREVSLAVKRGDLVGLIGPNGSGKTTLLRAIGRVLRPNTGEVRLAGQDIYLVGQKRVAQQVATVPQEMTIAFDFTVQEVVLMGRTPHLKRFTGEDAADFSIVEQAMRRARVLHLKERSITQLSGGEKQKVIIAQALAQRPELLLLDEPTSHLDIHHQLEILDLVQSLSQRGVAVIASFHDLNLAAQYCDYILLLSGGRLRVTGTPEEIFTADRIKEHFGVTVAIARSEATGKLIVTAYSDRLKRGKEGGRG